MTIASAWLDGGVATFEEIAYHDALLAWGEPLTPDLADAPPRPPGIGMLHAWGPRKGEIFVTTGTEWPKPDGFHDLPYVERYMLALEQLMRQEPRVRAGHAYRIEII